MFRFLKAFLVLSFISTAAAQTFEIQEGKYSDGNFEFYVRKGSYAKEGLPQVWYAIEAHGSVNRRPQFTSFYFDPVSGNATTTPWRSGPGRTKIGNYIPDGDFNLLSTAIDGGGLRHFRWKRGGAWNVNDQILEMVLDQVTGHIVSLSTNHRIARWSLPSGWHSGPLKQDNWCFECKDLEFQPSNARPSQSEDLRCMRLIESSSATGNSSHRE